MRVAVYTLHTPVAGEQAELHNSLAEELVVQESSIHVPSLDVGIGLEAVPEEGSSKRKGAEAEPEECSTLSPDRFLGRSLGRSLVPPPSILPILHSDDGGDGGDDATFDCDRLQRCIELRVSSGTVAGTEMRLCIEFKGQLFATKPGQHPVLKTGNHPPALLSRLSTDHRRDDSTRNAHPSNPSSKHSQNTIHRTTAIQRPCPRLQTTHRIHVQRKGALLPSGPDLP